MADMNNNQNTEPTNTEPVNTEPKDTEPANAETGDQPLTMESMAVMIKSLQAQYAETQNKNNKLASENGQLRKQLQAKLTAEEKEEQAKAEAEAAKQQELETTKKELEILKSTNSYMAMGFDKELAESTATAAYEHDQVTVNANFSKWQEEQAKAIESRIRAEFMKNMPAPHSGNQPSGVDYTKIKEDATARGDMVALAAAIRGEHEEKQRMQAPN